MKEIWRHPWFVLMSNIALVLALYTLMRLACYWFNGAMFSDVNREHLLEILRGGVRFDLTAVLYLCSLYAIGMLLPLPPEIRELPWYQKTMRWLFWVPNSLGIVVNCIDIVYIRFTDRRTTCTFFAEFAHDNNIWHILRLGMTEYWYVTLLGVAMLVLLFVFTRREYGAGARNKTLYYLRETLIFILSAYFCVIGIRGGFGRYTRPITISNAAQYTNTPRETALVLNTPFSLMKSLENRFYIESHYFESDELEAHMTPVHPADDSRTARFDNVVILILESFGTEYIGFYNRDISGYKGYTPFLDSLLSQSITYDFSYASGRKSIDAMPSVLSSIPMLIEPYIVTPYSTNEVSSIAERLRWKGYRTAFFHGAPNGSMGFQAYARSAGFGRYYGMDEFGDASAFDGTWAIWDEEFLQFYAATMSRMQEPFMTAVFTASSHHPFRVPARYEKVFPQGTLPIHQTIGYTDYALRRFFDYAKQQPWYDHTLFVITADHTNESVLPQYANARGLYRVPIAFFHPHMRAERRHQVISQTDIMPSVLAYLGYDAPYFAFGEDALTQPKTHPYAVCYNAPYYQILSDSLLMQFDGDIVVGVYDYLHDPMLHANRIDQPASEQTAKMEDYLKAYIQQYIYRMVHNELTVDGE